MKKARAGLLPAARVAPFRSPPLVSRMRGTISCVSVGVTKRPALAPVDGAVTMHPKRSITRSVARWEKRVIWPEAE